VTEDEARWLIAILSSASDDLRRRVKDIVDMDYEGDIGDLLRAKADCSDAIEKWRCKVRAALQEVEEPSEDEE